MHLYNRFMIKENTDFFNLPLSEQEKYKINNREFLEFRFINFICNYHFNINFNTEQDYIDYDFTQENSLKIRKELQYFRGVGDNFFYIDSYFNRKPMYEFETLYDFDKETSNDNYQMNLNIHLTGGILKEANEYNFYYFNLLTISSYILSVVREDTTFILDETELSDKDKFKIRQNLGKYHHKIKKHIERKTEHNKSIWVINNNEKLRPHKAYIFSGNNITKNINLSTWQKDTEKYFVEDFSELNDVISDIKERYNSILNKEINKMLNKEDVFDSKVLKFKRNIKIGSITIQKSIDRLSYSHKKSF